MDDIFFIDDEGTKNPSEIKEDKKKKSSIPNPTLITQEEVLQKFYDKASFKRKIKISIFKQVDKKLLENISNLIMQKKMSYRSGLNKIQEVYPHVEVFKTTRHESLRYYLIKHDFITNERALETINKSISNSGYARNKRDKIVKDVIEDILDNYLEKIIEHPTFQKIILEEIKKHLEAYQK